MQNYWGAQSPRFLEGSIEYFQDEERSEITVSSIAFSPYEITDIGEFASLFNAGYLAIKGKTQNRLYTLGYPNLEVEEVMRMEEYG